MTITVVTILDCLTDNLEVDKEHIDLILSINRICEYYKEKGLKNKVPSLIASFGVQLLSHFQTEELSSLVTEEHRKDHARITQETLLLLQDFYSNTDYIVERFEEMLINHTREFDIPTFKK